MAKTIVEVDVQIKGSDTVDQAAKKTQAYKEKITELKQVLATLPKDSDAFNTISKSIEGLSAKIGLTEVPVKNLKAQLREMKAQLASGTLDNDAFNKLAKEAGALEDRIADVNAQVKNLGSDSRNLEGLIGLTEGIVGGFAAIQGITALVGQENEDLNKTLVKIQATISVLNGLQAINNALQKESSAAIFVTNVQTRALAAGQAILAFATGGATAAMNALRVAVLLTGFGALVVAIVAAAKALDDYTSSVDKAAEAQEDLIKSIDRENEALEFDLKKAKQRSDQRYKLAELEGASVEELAKIKKEGLQEQVAIIQQEINENEKSVITASKNAELRLRQQAIVNEGQLYGAEMRKKIRDDEEKDIEENRKRREEREKQERDQRLQQAQKDAADGLKAHNDLQERLREAYLTDEEFELSQLKRKYAAEKLELERFLQDTSNLTDLYEQERLSIKQRYANQEIEDQEKNYQDALALINQAQQEQANIDKQELDNKRFFEEQKFAIANAGLDLLGSLSGKNKELALAGFVLEKAAAVGSVIINTQREIAGYYANPTWSALPDGGLTLKTAAAAGAKIRAGLSIGTIAATTFGKLSGSTGSGGGSVPSGGQQSSAPPSSVFLANDTNTDGLSQQPIRVEVLEKDITVIQSRVRRIRNQSILE